MNSTAMSRAGPIKAIFVHVPAGIPTSDGGLEIPNRVFLGGIPSETTEMELELFFSDYGMVKDVRIVTDRVTGECKGYGFVTFDENEDISKLVCKKSIVMKGRKLRVRKAIRRNGSQFCQASPEAMTSGSSSTPSSSGTYYLVPMDNYAVPQQSPLQYGYMHSGNPPVTSNPPVIPHTPVGPPPIPFFSQQPPVMMPTGMPIFQM